MRGVIIQGSARSKGNTNIIARFIQKETGFDIIDLRTYRIGPFDYEFANSDDDFLPLMQEIVNTYDTIIFATPVYWYAMSGIMKNFFDRISDCLKTHKDMGRQLRGKSMGMISCGSDAQVIEGFEMPFEKSAHYLGMHYLGSTHTWLEDDHITPSLKNTLITFLNQPLTKEK